MHSLTNFVVLLTLGSIAVSELPHDRFGGNVAKNWNAKFKLAWPNALLFGAKVNLAVAKIDLSNGKIGLSVAKVDLSGDDIIVPKGNVDLSGCKDVLPTAEQDSSGSKTALNAIHPTVFTYCLTVNLTVNSKQERFEEVNDLSNNKSKFAIEASEGGNRLILHNYKEEFGTSFFWVKIPTECCVSWVKSTKEFHLYLEGNHVLGGTGNIEWSSLDKIEKSVVQEGQTTETLSGPIIELKQWNRVLNKDEVQQVADGKLKGDIVNGKSPNWKLTATAITESLSPAKTCAQPTSSVLDLIPLDLSKQNPAFVQTSIEFPKPLTKKFEELSLCAWFYYRSIEDLPISLLYYLGVDYRWALTFHIRKDKTLYGWNDLKEKIAFPLLEPGKWHHFCFTWSEIRNGTVDIYHDSSLALHRQVMNGSAHIGEVIQFENFQDAPFDPQNPTKGYAGKITGIDVWDYPITPEEVVQSYTCPAKYPGNFISWEKSGKAYNPII